MRTYSPVRLVRYSSRPYFDSKVARNAFGTLSRPLSSMRAGAFPLNKGHYSTSLHKSPQDGRRGSPGCQPQYVVSQLVTPYFRPLIALRVRRLKLTRLDRPCSHAHWRRYAAVATNPACYDGGLRRCSGQRSLGSHPAESPPSSN